MMPAGAHALIRPVSPRDRDGYILMARDFYSTGAVMKKIPDECFERAFGELMRSDEYAKAYMIESGGVTAGYALTAKTYSQEAGGMVLWLEEIYIKPEYRGRGLGGEFLEYARNTLGREYARLRLELEPGNDRAAELYRRHGFSDFPYLQMALGG
jgi:GNAT superfamily N-acetyltransferase